MASMTIAVARPTATLAASGAIRIGGRSGITPRRRPGRAPGIDSAASGSAERTSATSWQFGNSGQRTHSFQILCGSSDFSTW